MLVLIVICLITFLAFYNLILILFVVSLILQMKRFVDESGSLREQILKLEELLLSKNNILQV